MARIKPHHPKYKLTLSVDQDFARRFTAFAGFLGEDLSEIAVRALKKEMKGFSVSRRVDGADQADEPAEGTVRMARRDDGRATG